jgi:hypothetical protein
MQSNHNFPLLSPTHIQQNPPNRIRVPLATVRRSDSAIIQTRKGIGLRIEAILRQVWVCDFVNPFHGLLDDRIFARYAAVPSSHSVNSSSRQRLTGTPVSLLYSLTRSSKGPETRNTESFIVVACLTGDYGLVRME